MAESIGNENRTEAEIAGVRACLHKILISPLFAQSERLQRFLKFIVNETLTGHTDRLKGYTIGIEVFDRDASFDSAIDTIVRVEAARLRAKLREYYDGEGRADPVRFDLPKGSYAVRIERQEPVAARSVAPQRVPDAASIDSVRLIEDKPSLAVLPFANMSNDRKQEYFVDGITDSLITELSRLPGLFVISRHSSFVYKGVSKRAEEIGAELGVRYLLEGGVQRAGGRVRITVQLIDTASGAHLWAERYDRELKDIFAVQDDATQRIVGMLQVKLTGVERIYYSGTASLEAYDCLLRGMERFWIFTPASVEEARKHLAKAIELEPGYAMAHAWLARVLIFQWLMIWDMRDETQERAYAHARIAADLEPQLPFAHSMLCWVQLRRGHGEAAIAAGWEAVKLDPNNADAHQFLAYALASMGRGEEALHYIKRGIRLNPHSSTTYQNALGICYFALEEYEQAIIAFKRGIQISDAFISNHFNLCLIYAQLGRNEELQVSREKVLTLSGGHRPVIRTFWLDEDLRLRMQALTRLAGLE